jgi:uncharacterized protein YjbI with pentapeptide repeats
MSKIFSDLISAFLIPKVFKQETVIQFKALSKEIVKNTKIFLPKDFQNYQKICLDLKKICDPTGLQKITKWEQVVSSTIQLRKNISQFKPSQENSSDEFNSISLQIVENFEYLQTEDLANFQNICDTVDSDQNKTVATWRSLAQGQGLKVNLYGNELIILPASFKKSSFLHPLLKEAISKNKLILQASDEAIDPSKKHLVEQALLNPAELIITNENIWDILKIADFYQINKLKKAVCEFSKTMPPDDLLDILFYSKKFNLDDLYNFHFSTLEQIDNESLAPILNDLLEIATQNNDEKLAIFLFFHVLATSKDPIAAGRLAFLQQLASLITSLKKPEMNWPLFKIALLLLKFNLKEIDLSSTPITDDELRKVLKKNSKLQKINLSGTNIIGTAFDSEITTFEHLIEIDISDCSKLTDEILKILFEKCPNLQKINLSKTNITGTAFESEAINLENLTEIDMKNCLNLTDVQLKILMEKCSQLQKINLHGANIIGTAFDSEAINLGNLTEIDFSFCWHLRDNHLKLLIEKCSQLQKIDLYHTHITGAAFDSEAVRLEKLTEINIACCFHLTDHYLKKIIEKCPNLQKINLYETYITGAAFDSEVIHLENLTRISIAGCQNFTDHYLKMLIARCPNLQEVNLNKTNITGAVFDSEAVKHEKLNTILLSWCRRLEDENLKRWIEKCPNLKKIILSHTTITGAAFDSEAIKLEHLTEIDISGCENFTDDNLKILIEKCSKLQKIILSHTTITGAAFDSNAIKFEYFTEINISSCPNINDYVVKMLIERCLSLQNIRLEDLNITGSAFDSEDVQLEHLTEISLSRCHYLVDNNLKRLIEKCPNLQKVNLYGTEITGAAFDSEDVQLEHLTEINMSCSKLTDKNLKILIEKCPNLQKINFSFTNITGAAFDSETIHLEHLIEIDLSKCPNFSDDYLKMLIEKCPKLQKINFSFTNITGAAFVPEAIKLENLTKVEIKHCNNFTIDNLKILINKCPNWRIK